jgi:hypothetical protein
MVLTNRNEMTWLAIQLAPLPYYRTDCSQLTQVLSFPYVRLTDFFFFACVLRPSYSYLMYFMLPKIVLTYFTKNKFTHFLNDF